MNDRFGTVFWQQITAGARTSKRKFTDNSWSQPRSNQRIGTLIILLFFGCILLTARLFFITLIEGGRFRQLAEENRIREAKIEASRGIVYDRNGNPLVRNIPAYVDKEGLRVLTIPQNYSSGLYRESVARDYVYGQVLGHALGYVGEFSFDDVGQYKEGDTVGKMGIESVYDEWLRGVDGKELFEIDAAGHIERTLGRVESVEGRNLQLTIDIHLQNVAHELMVEKSGAIVVSDPRSGEVLSIVSSPGFDPNIFVKGDVEQILKRNDQPLFDRSVSGQYPPGSIFKIITAIAGLSTGKITQFWEVEDTGVLTVGQFSFGNWYFSQYGKKEGNLNIVSALKRSNDIYFYKAGEAIGIDTLAAFARRMGLDSRTGIDLPSEAMGLMPDPGWREKEKGEKWYLGNTYHVAIGQGDILMTPVQVNALTNLVANGGNLCQPYLAKTQNSKFKTQNNCMNLEINRETIELVREGMKQACAPGGTGWPLFKFKVNPPAGGEKLKVDGVDFLDAKDASGSAKSSVEIPVACKTGTAEYGDPKNRTHAWFTAFAPVYNPQISVTVLVEGGGEGSSVAAPIAKKILEKWFEK